MTNKMRDAINSVMVNYDLSELEVLLLLANGAKEMRKRALIDWEDPSVARKMIFVQDHVLNWIEFMKGGDC